MVSKNGVCIYWLLSVIGVSDVSVCIFRISSALVFIETCNRSVGKMNRIFAHCHWLSLTLRDSNMCFFFCYAGCNSCRNKGNCDISTTARISCRKSVRWVGSKRRKDKGWQSAWNWSQQQDFRCYEVRTLSSSGSGWTKKLGWSLYTVMEWKCNYAWIVGA